MSQFLLSLDAVSSNTIGSVLSFNSTQTKYTMQYIATVPGGNDVKVSLEGSLDGTNFSEITSGAFTSDSNGFMNASTPVLFIRARATGLSGSSWTVTALLGVAQ